MDDFLGRSSDSLGVDMCCALAGSEASDGEEPWDGANEANWEEMKRSGGCRVDVDDDEGEDGWPKLHRTREYFRSEDEDIVLSCEAEPRWNRRVPARIAKHLRDYQREGVKFLYRRFTGEWQPTQESGSPQKDCGGILGDDMGLGKTVQVAAFLAAMLEKDATMEDKRKAEDFRRAEHSKGDTAGRARRERVLVIAPKSVVFQWREELSTWSFFDVGICMGPSADSTLGAAERCEHEVVCRNLCCQTFARHRGARALLVGAKARGQVVVATYEACKTHIDRIRAIPWLCIVADEAHRLKNTETDTYKARALAGLQSPFAAVIMQ